MAHTKREEKYDEHISPLMVKIIELSKKYDIPMIACFQLNDDYTNVSEETGEDIEDYYCTTRTFELGTAGDKLNAAAQAVEPDQPIQWNAHVIVDGKSTQIAGSDMDND